jgi:tRNA(fMet)-specific endonuclease VapC
MHLPDTNAVSAYLRGRDEKIRALLNAHFSELYLSTVVVAELEYGASKRPDLPQLRVRLDSLLDVLPVLDFDRVDAAFYGRIRAHLATLKPNAQPIGPYDLILAAQAMRHGATVITHNRRKFDRVPGLLVEDWQS